MTPGVFEGIEDAVESIGAAIAAGKRITVHGDYDVDGICSTSIMVAALRRAGADCDWLIPDRLGDGYGLSAGSLDHLARAADRAAGHRRLRDRLRRRDRGDRARPGSTWSSPTITSPASELPDCPIVHPGVCDYPFEGLCGAAVAAKLAQALEREIAGDESGGIRDLDLVALATVADLVPLVGENRFLVRRGLAQIRRAPRPGLRALMAISRVRARADRRGRHRLPPRPAAERRRAPLPRRRRRRADADRGPGPGDGDRRRARRRQPRAARDRAGGQQRGRGGPAGPARRAARGAGDRGRRRGLASGRRRDRRLAARRAARPPGDRARDRRRRAAKGSGRSVAGFDLLAALDACAEHLDRYGGHRAAAGVELPAARIDDFRARPGRPRPHGRAGGGSRRAGADRRLRRRRVARPRRRRAARHAGAVRPGQSRGSGCSSPGPGSATCGRWARRASMPASASAPGRSRPAASPSTPTASSRRPSARPTTSRSGSRSTTGTVRSSRGRCSRMPSPADRRRSRGRSRRSRVRRA